MYIDYRNNQCKNIFNYLTLTNIMSILYINILIHVDM